VSRQPDPTGLHPDVHRRDARRRTCEKLEDPDGPVWSKVHLENVEAFGGGTLAYDAENDTVSPHIHVSVGLKPHSATAHTSHLLGATIQFLTEMYLV